MAEHIRQLNESVVIRSLRRFTDKYFPSRSNSSREMGTPDRCSGEQLPPCLLDVLPVDVHFLIMTFLSPADICRLGGTNQYWRMLARDPLLWRYFLQRDIPHWSSIDHVTMPRLDVLDDPLVDEDESLDDREEGTEKAKESKCDYMAEYLKACPTCRQHWLPSRAPYEVFTSFLQSLVPSAEPRYAMFGPGMEQLRVSLVTRLMHAPDLLPLAGTPQRQINGIGSGISYLYNNQHKFNILTLYSTNRAERERARVHQQATSNKLFSCEGTDQSGCPVFSLAPHVQQVCQLVDGFIYVANAECERGEMDSEAAQIRAGLSSTWGSVSRPLLVLSCVSREEPDINDNPDRAEESGRRHIPCIYMAQRLGLPQLANPWMVQDTVAESLSGLLDGLSWLLKCSGVKVSGS